MELPQIKSLSELLVEVGLIDSPRKAAGAVKAGEVTFDGLRVANADALLVITQPVTLSCRGKEVVLGALDNQNDNRSESARETTLERAVRV